jgi:hypothetical protein
MVFDIAFGGLVRDNWDRRMLSTIGKFFVNPTVLEDGHNFCPKFTEFQYVIPDAINHE